MATSFSPSPENAHLLADEFQRVMAAMGFEHPERLIPGVEWLQAPRGDIVIQEGDVGDVLYVLLRGRARVVTALGTPSEQTVSILGAGQIFGELSMLTNETRMASVQTLRDSELAAVPRTFLERILAADSRLILPLAQLVARRLRTANHRGPATRPTTVTWLPVGGHRDTSALFEEVVRSLRAKVKIAAITAADVPRTISAQGLTGWLNRMEAECDLLLLNAAGSDHDWIAHCVRQADRILHVLRSDHPPQPALPDVCAMIDGIRPVPPPEDLVLLHGKTVARPQGTARWLALRRFRELVHVRDGDPNDPPRLARMLLKRSVGLVLSGGGARAFAHIGVLRAMEEAKIPIDLVGGTSMGSILAAQYAMGWTPEQMHEANKREWGQAGINRRVTLPLVSLFSCHVFVRLLERMFGDVQYEDLWRPCFATATNLTTCQLDVVRRGRVAYWTRASSSPPGLWPPVATESGELLVDGGVLDNVPVGPMRAGGASRVIVANASPYAPLRVTPYAGDIRGGLGQLARLVNRRDTALPSIVSVLYRTIGVTGQQKRKTVEELADLYIEPPLGKRIMFNYGAIDRIVEAGYRKAYRTLEALDIERFLDGDTRRGGLV